MNVLAAVVACAEGPTVADTPVRPLAPCEPWSGWNLPPEGSGAIVACDPRHLVVHEPPGAAATRGPLWRLAIRSAGWEEDVDSSDVGLVNVRYGQDGLHLDLSAIDDARRTVVVLTLVP